MVTLLAVLLAASVHKPCRASRAWALSSLLFWPWSSFFGIMEQCCRCNAQSRSRRSKWPMCCTCGWRLSRILAMSTHYPVIPCPVVSTHVHACSSHFSWAKVESCRKYDHIRFAAGQRLFNSTNYVCIGSTSSDVLVAVSCIG